MLKKVFGKECPSHHHHSEEPHQPPRHEEDVSQGPKIVSPGGEVARDLHHHSNHPVSGRREQWQERREIMQGLALYFGVELPTPPPSSGEHTCGKSVGRPHFPLPKILKAIKRIRAVNQKLVAFERGFISEDGLPSREWYKHLGVAPGRWLGWCLFAFVFVATETQATCL